MSHMFTRPKSFILLALLLASACTQSPAQIVNKGGGIFGRNGNYANNSYTGPISLTRTTKTYTTSESAPIAPYHEATGTVPNASVGSIGVTDLAPPAALKQSTASTAGNTPFKSTSVSNLSPAAGPKTIAPAAEAAPRTNPWNNKAREVELKRPEDHSFNLRPQARTTKPKDQLVSEVKTPSSDNATSKLDSIIGNEGGGSKIDAAAITKQSAKSDSGDFMWPVNSKKVISAYGPKGKGKANDGINIASANGEPIWAAADGEVVYVGNELGGYGNMVVIKHNGEKSTSYAHMSRATVDKYDRVKQGDIIGYVGSTGNVKDPQLHFAIRNGKDPLDPIKFMKSSMASLR